jgi:hypothetical protein
MLNKYYSFSLTMVSNSFGQNASTFDLYNVLNKNARFTINDFTYGQQAAVTQFINNDGGFGTLINNSTMTISYGNGTANTLHVLKPNTTDKDVYVFNKPGSAVDIQFIGDTDSMLKYG